MEWNDPTLQLVTAHPYTISFNQTSGDTYLLDPDQCSGLDQAPIRFNTEQAPQEDGGIKHPSFYDIRHITLGGTLLVRSSGTEAGYISARQTLEDNLIIALDDCLNTDATLSWASGGRSQTVTCEIGAAFPGAFQKTFTLGLASMTPKILEVT